MGDIERGVTTETVSESFNDSDTLFWSLPNEWSEPHYTSFDTAAFRRQVVRQMWSLPLLQPASLLTTIVITPHRALPLNNSAGMASLQIIAQVALTTATLISAAAGNYPLSQNAKILLSFAAACTVVGFLACLSVIGLSSRSSSGFPAQLMLRVGCFASASGFLAFMGMLLPDHLKLWTAGTASMACFLIAVSPVIVK